MPNRLAATLVGLIVVLVAADFGLNGGAASLFLARRLDRLIEFLAFWR